ncbi:MULTISPECIES: hypothetical protein [unclassified Actinobaculum]|uniref:hypothetical protein n=1 Tax=unclassified Actinobaculum TaxID=2609299 RepID=UPI001F0C2267|nr:MULTISPECIES: hypothetical protein [unclassified Actinobaculum]
MPHTASFEGLQEPLPRRVALGVGTREAQDVASALVAHADSGHERLGPDPTIQATLQVGRIKDEITQAHARPVLGEERVNLTINDGEQPTQLVLGQRLHAELCCYLLHLARRGASDVHLGVRSSQRPVGPASPLGYILRHRVQADHRYSFPVRFGEPTF